MPVHAGDYGGTITLTVKERNPTTKVLQIKPITTATEMLIRIRKQGGTVVDLVAAHVTDGSDGQMVADIPDGLFLELGGKYHAQGIVTFLTSKYHGDWVEFPVATNL
jgi:hypothetical protein